MRPLILAILLAACGRAKDAAPPCSLPEGQVFDDVATCGPCSDQPPYCEPGYFCADCAHYCTWFAGDFPPDGSLGCPVDAGSDAARQVDASLDAAVPPTCPLPEGEQFPDYATCGTCNHDLQDCTTGYYCTCAGVCTWFVQFPQDAGPAGCGLDAG